jgi:hypothetical protein
LKTIINDYNRYLPEADKEQGTGLFGIFEGKGGEIMKRRRKR